MKRAAHAVGRPDRAREHLQRVPPPRHEDHFGPRAASCLAIASPIPLDAPVTRAVFPVGPYDSSSPPWFLLVGRTLMHGGCARWARRLSEALGARGSCT
jgi:hypothetical protein